MRHYIWWCLDSRKISLYKTGVKWDEGHSLLCNSSLHFSPLTFNTLYVMEDLSHPFPIKYTFPIKVTKKIAPMVVYITHCIMFILKTY